MKKYSAEELDRILDAHKKWLNGEKGGIRANLYNADLSKADLYNANLYNADLSNADLSNANLSNADLSGARIVFPIACPEVGSFIGWKTAGHKIVKLKIAETAQRSSATSRKCRCSEAAVLSIENEDGTEFFETAVSSHDKSFVYKVGETVKVDDFDENRWNECAPGIHFFITRQEAVDYM